MTTKLTAQQFEYLSARSEGRPSTLRSSNSLWRMIEKMRRDGLLIEGSKKLPQKAQDAMDAYKAAHAASLAKVEEMRKRIEGGEYPVIEIRDVEANMFFLDGKLQVGLRATHDGWRYRFTIEADNIHWPDLVLRHPLRDGETARGLGIKCFPHTQPFAAAVVGATLKRVHEMAMISAARVRYDQKRVEAKRKSDDNIAKQVVRDHAAQMYAILKLTPHNDASYALVSEIDAKIAAEQAKAVSSYDYDV